MLARPVSAPRAPAGQWAIVWAMRRAILLSLFGLCVSAQQQASLEGTAVNAITGEPLAGVHLRLVAIMFSSVSGAYGAMSDSAGHFSIATVRPGTYILFPEKNGYLHVNSKDSAAVPNLVLKPGQQLTGYRLEMTPRAILAGKVVDENGDPVQGIQVGTVVVPPATESIVMMSTPSFGTDDRGEFRLSVAPGKYYLRATPQNFSA